MAFGLRRAELVAWKQNAAEGRIAFITHYWQDPRFPDCYTVTKVGCRDIEKLKKWGRTYGLKAAWIDDKQGFPHFDLFGDKQRYILQQEQQWRQLERFHL